MNLILMCDNNNKYYLIFKKDWNNIFYFEKFGFESV